MVRCSRCGLRLAEVGSACPFDGTQPVTPGLSDERESGAISAEAGRVSRPRIVGLDVQGELGRGGFATVYVARRHADGALLALKVAADGPRALESLFRESLVLQTLQGDHAPAIIGFGVSDDGRPYVAMERKLSQTLSDLLVTSRGSVPWLTFRAVALGLVDAVDALHRHGLVHRDLKPENIFIDPDVGVTLIDFGLTTPAEARDLVDARMRSEPPPPNRQEDDAGTPEYMSPEQSLGLPSDARSDVYALGVILYELLAGAPPFFGPSADVLEAHRVRSPNPLSSHVGCPAVLSEAIGSCLAKIPADRPANLVALRATLESALDAVDPSFQPQRAIRVEAAPPQSPSLDEEVTAALVYFRSDAKLVELGRIAAPLGGIMAHERGDAKVAMFWHASTQQPTEAAHAFAKRLRGIGMVARARLHLASVTLKTNRNRLRVVGTALHDAGLWPSPDDPAGLLVSSELAHLMRGQQLESIVGRSDVFLVTDELTDMTTMFAAQLPLLGRDAESAALNDSFARGLENRWVTLCTVTGDAGMGKSHLVREVAKRCGASTNVETVWLSARAGDTNWLPQSVLRFALHPPLMAPADGGQAFLTQALHPVGAQVWPAAALQLGWVDTKHPQVANLTSAPGALRMATARAIGEALRKAAQRRPLALFIDDAHLADDATLDALEYVALDEIGAALWMLVSARNQLSTSRKAWAARARHRLSIALSVLAQDESEALFRLLLSHVTQLSAQALALLHERTQGVPGQMIELVDALKKDGIVRQIPGGRGFMIATDELSRLPELPVVEWTTVRELKRMPDDLLRTAQVAAALGSQFTLSELAAVQRRLQAESPSEPWLDARMALRRLSRQGFLRFSADLFRFNQPLCADLLYKRTPAGYRERIHRAALDALRSLPLTELEHLAHEARHAEGAGDRERAVDAGLALAEHLVARQDYRGAEAAFAAVLTNLGSARDVRFVQAARGLGTMRFRLSRHAEALEVLQQAREAAHELGDLETEAHVLLDEAMAHYLNYGIETSQDLGERAIALVPDPTPLLRARGVLALSRNAQAAGTPRPAVTLALRAIEIVEPLGESGYETQVVALLLAGFSIAQLGSAGSEADASACLEQATELLDRAVELARRHGDLVHAASGLKERALVNFCRAREQAMFADIEDAIRISREAGLSVEPWFLDAKAEFHIYLGQASEATALIASKRAIADALGVSDTQIQRDRMLEARVAMRRRDRRSVGTICKAVRTAMDAAPGRTLLFSYDEMLLPALELISRDPSPQEVASFLEGLDRFSWLAPDYGELLEGFADYVEDIGEGAQARAIRLRAIDHCAHFGAPLMSRRIEAMMTAAELAPGLHQPEIAQPPGRGGQSAQG